MIINHTPATDRTHRIPASLLHVGDRVLFGTVTALTYLSTSPSYLHMTVNGRTYKRYYTSMVTTLI